LILKNLTSAFRKIKIAGSWIIIPGFLLLAVNGTRAQGTDTAVVKSAPLNHSPRKATLYSAIVPGLGQAYNRKYWKIPIIYGAGGAFAYYVVFNQVEYQKFRKAITNTDPGSRALIDGRYFDYESLPRGRDYYRRYRDLSVLGLGLIYFLNIVDAMIDAQFYYYDVSDDLSMKIQPTIFNESGTTSAIGFRIDIVF